MFARNLPKFQGNAVTVLLAPAVAKIGICLGFHDNGVIDDKEVDSAVLFTVCDGTEAAAATATKNCGVIISKGVEGC